MTFRRCRLVFACGLALVVLISLPAAAAQAASQSPPAGLTTPLLLQLEGLQSSGCAAPAAQTVTPATGEDPLGSLEVNPFASSQNLCTHPSCPPGQLYDCVCMVCHPRCQSGYFWDSDFCACQPI
jgi:hypothetical protein